MEMVEFSFKAAVPVACRLPTKGVRGGRNVAGGRMAGHAVAVLSQARQHILSLAGGCISLLRANAAASEPKKGQQHAAQQR